MSNSDTEIDRRYFTIEEANSYVAILQGQLPVLMQLRAQIERLHRRLDNAGYPAVRSEEDHITLQMYDDAEDPPRLVLADAGMLQASYNALYDQMGEVLDIGCRISDIESGQVDWPALHKGREILLCWRCGESEVGHWRESSGSSDKRPLEELNVE